MKQLGGIRSSRLARTCALALSWLWPGAAASAQSIAIQQAPPYGSPGFLQGTVSGVNFTSHRVAVYLYIDGAGWWSKPSPTSATWPIAANGTFAANVYNCCLDDRATIYVAALVPPGGQAPTASGSCRVPAGLQAVATTHMDRPGRTLQFAGKTWAVKEAPSPVGPGGNPFTDDPQDVFVDAQGRLHLRVVFRNGAWRSSEVVLMQDTGYGTYWFTTESQVHTLDPRLTFGAFTWDAFCDDATIPQWPNREIDFEDSRWGNAGDPTTSQVVVQPYDVGSNLVRYTTPPLVPSPTLTRFFKWTPQQVEFGAVTGKRSPGSIGAGSIVHQSVYTHAPTQSRRVPPSGRQRFRFNLWVNSGGGPSDGQTAEVVVSSFVYEPVLGAFPGGCGFNPQQSLRILSGGPRLGATVTLGVDNPAGTQSAGSISGLALGVGAARFPCGLLQLG